MKEVFNENQNLILCLSLFCFFPILLQNIHGKKKSAFLRHFFPFKNPHNWQGEASQPKQYFLFFKARRTPKGAFLPQG